MLRQNKLGLVRETSLPCPLVTIVIPTWNSLRWLPGCFSGLRAQQYPHMELIVVDNGSTDGTVACLQSDYPEARLIQFPENRGFAAAVNAGIQQARGQFIALLNVDTVATPMWLSALVDAAQHSPPDVGSWASKMVSLTDPSRIDDAGDTLSWYGSARKRGLGQPAAAYTQADEVFSACAGAALYRRSFFEAVGLFDETFGSYLEDIDLGLRGRLLGFRCRYVPQAEVWHKGQGSGTVRPYYVYLMTRNRLLLLSKNIPMGLLIKHFWRWLYGQVYFFLVYKHPWQSLRGYAAFLKLLPQTWRARRTIQHHRRLSAADLEACLSRELGEPSLREILLKRWRARSF